MKCNNVGSACIFISDPDYWRNPYKCLSDQSTRRIFCSNEETLVGLLMAPGEELSPSHVRRPSHDVELGIFSYALCPPERGEALKTVLIIDRAYVRKVAHTQQYGVRRASEVGENIHVPGRWCTQIHRELPVLADTTSSSIYSSVSFHKLVNLSVSWSSSKLIKPNEGVCRNLWFVTKSERHCK